MEAIDTKCRLVLVDDEPLVIKALEREIRIRYPESRFDISAYTDARVCLSELSARSDDVFLVISDLRMPAMNGAELLEGIRAANPAVQTALLTAYSDMDDIRRAVSTSIRSLLPKPWVQETLFGEIDRALSDFRLRKENERLGAEMGHSLALAGEFQKAVLDDDRRRLASPAVDVAYRPLDGFECGGDFYDAFALPDGRAAVLLGDVSGHGLRPALVTIMLKAAVNGMRGSRPEAFSSPASLVSALNDALCEYLAAAPDALVALAAAFIDEARGTVTVSNAGLPSVVLARRASAAELFSADGPALGFCPGRAYTEMTEAYRSGDRLVLFTDGLIDVACLGDAVKLEEAVTAISQAACAGLGASGVCDVLRSRHPGGRFSDDVAVLVASL